MSLGFVNFFTKFRFRSKNQNKLIKKCQKRTSFRNHYTYSNQRYKNSLIFSIYVKMDTKSLLLGIKPVPSKQNVKVEIEDNNDEVEVVGEILQKPVKRWKKFKTEEELLAKKAKLESEEYKNAHVLWVKNFETKYGYSLPNEITSKCQPKECGLCELDLATIMDGKIHYEGKRHLATAKRHFETLSLKSGALGVPMEWTKEIPMKIPIEVLNKCTTLRCDICEKVFDCTNHGYNQTKEHYSSSGHLKKIRKLLNIGKDPPKTSKNHKKIPKVNDKKCDACERTFASTEALKEHLRSAICYGDFKYNCNFCDKRFSRKDILNDHLYMRHDYNYREGWKPRSTTTKLSPHGIVMYQNK